MTTRSARDDHRLLLPLMGLLLAAAALMDQAPLWVSGTLLACLGLRIGAIYRGWGVVPRLVLVGLVVGLTVGVLANFQTLNGLQAGGTLLMAMAALKVLESRTSRDDAVLVLIGFFLCLASLLVEQSIFRLLHALLCVWLLTAALLASQRPTEASASVPLTRGSARLLLLGAPFTIVLFVFVPRLEGHFWAIPAPADEASSGLSDLMNPGAIAHLVMSDEPAFRVQFNGALPPASQRYWRAMVLEDFDGRSWRRAQALTNGAPPVLEANGSEFSYTVTLEPTQQNWLPTLDHLLRVEGVSAQRLHDDMLIVSSESSDKQATITSLTRYQAVSAPAARVNALELSDFERSRQTRLPADSAPKARAMAVTLRTQLPSDTAYIERVLALFHEQNFQYTLDPPPLTLDPVDEFLFSTREGFCEHYAMAFTVLMRLAGIPARVVVGFQGGELNHYAGYLLIRQSHAHAWSEVWLNGQGWIRVDPTSVVAPERIRRDLAGGPQRASAQNSALFESSWALSAREGIDAIRNLWKQAIIGFSAQSQSNLLERLGWKGLPAQGLVLALAIGMMLAGGVLYVLQNLALKRQAQDPVQQAWLAMGTRLAARGMTRAPHEGPLDFSRRLGEQWPSQSAAITDLTQRYLKLRYENQTDPLLQRNFIRDARRYRPRGRPRA